MSNRIYERSDGRLKITANPSGVWGYASFTVQRPVGEGLIEMGQGTGSGITEEPIYLVFASPIFEGVPECKIGWDGVKAELEAAAERMNCKLIGVYSNGPAYVHSTKELAKLEDFKGLKVRSWNPIMTKWLEEMGAMPHVIPYAECYQSLATGVVEANFCGPSTVPVMKWWEVTPYYNIWGAIPHVSPLFVNLDAFNELTPDLQDILVEEAEGFTEYLWDFYITGDGSLEKSLADMQKQGMTVVYPDPADLQKSSELYIKLTEEWVKEKGPEAEASLHKVLKALGKE